MMKIKIIEIMKLTFSGSELSDIVVRTNVPVFVPKKRSVAFPIAAVMTSSSVDGVHSNNGRDL